MQLLPANESGTVVITVNLLERCSSLKSAVATLLAQSWHHTLSGRDEPPRTLRSSDQWCATQRDARGKARRRTVAAAHAFGFPRASSARPARLHCEAAQPCCEPPGGWRTLASPAMKRRWAVRFWSLSAPGSGLCVAIPCRSRRAVVREPALACIALHPLLASYPTHPFRSGLRGTSWLDRDAGACLHRFEELIGGSEEGRHADHGPAPLPFQTPSSHT